MRYDKEKTIRNIDGVKTSNTKHFVKIFKRKYEDKYFVFVQGDSFFIFAGEMNEKELRLIRNNIDLIHAFKEHPSVERLKEKKERFSKILSKRHLLLNGAYYCSNVFLKESYESF